MGDRANIAIQYEDGKRIYFYGHWSGEDYAQALQRALAKRWRWNDEGYLARIIFDEFAGDNRGTETGLGISPGLLDNEHPILVVNVGSQMIFTEGDGRGYIDERAGRQWTFEQYVALPDVAAAVENRQEETESA